MKNIHHFSTSFRLKCITITVLAALADYLFYGHSAGWVTGLYAALVCVALIMHNPKAVESSFGKIIYILILVQCVWLLQRSSQLSIILIIIGISSLAVISKRGMTDDMMQLLLSALRQLVLFMGALFSAASKLLRYMPKARYVNRYEMLIKQWALPVCMSLLFLMLFAYANPIMEELIFQFDIGEVLPNISSARIIFWLITCCFLFRFIRPVVAPYETHADIVITHRSHWLLSKESLLRSLIMFNVLFAAQTIMDIGYLWSDAVLPDGISYAAYAHRGAYPLIATALLAAGFVLLAHNLGEDVRTDKSISTLIYIWIVQNILLVISSIYRTWLYVEEYGLTYLRVYAFIWMGMVACGLGWIILRNLKQKSNQWLINVNLLTLFSMLCAVSLVNIGSMIAEVNLAQDDKPDLYYIMELGKDAIIPLERYGYINEANEIIRRYTFKETDWRNQTLSASRILTKERVSRAWENCNDYYRRCR